MNIVLYEELVLINITSSIICWCMNENKVNVKHPFRGFRVLCEKFLTPEQDNYKLNNRLCEICYTHSILFDSCQNPIASRIHAMRITIPFEITRIIKQPFEIKHSYR